MSPTEKISFKTAVQIVTANSAGRSRRAVAKMKRSYDMDPAWNRGGNTDKKKRKMCSRASLKRLKFLAQKRKADTNRNPICVTRTVELPSTQTIGFERSKLLFMIAIGLTPNIAKPPLRDTGEPVIILNRMDPAVEAEAKARTREVLFQIFQNRKAETERRRARAIHYSSSHRSSLDQPREDNVEVVDLVSDHSEEDRSSQSEDELGGEGQHSRQSFPRNRLPKMPYRYNNRKQRATTDVDTSGYRIITSQPRKPVFKTLANNQGTKIFENWKPESMTKLMNKKKSEECNSPSSNGSHSILMSSVKSFPVSTLTVRNIASQVAADGSCKSQAHGAQEDASSVPRIKKLEYHVSSNLITID